MRTLTCLVGIVVLVAFCGGCESATQSKGDTIVQRVHMLGQSASVVGYEEQASLWGRSIRVRTWRVPLTSQDLRPEEP